MRKWNWRSDREKIQVDGYNQLFLGLYPFTWNQASSASAIMACWVNGLRFSSFRSEDAFKSVFESSAGKRKFIGTIGGGSDDGTFTVLTLGFACTGFGVSATAFDGGDAGTIGAAAEISGLGVCGLGEPSLIKATTSGLTSCGFRASAIDRRIGI